MSGLKLVPRIPNRPSTKNGNEAAISATIATGAPSRRAVSIPSTLPRRNASAPTVASSTAVAEITPWPGSRTVPQHSPATSANPMAGASHDHWRQPQRANAACPIARAATQIAITEA